MSSVVLANVYSDEGTLIGALHTVSIPWKARKSVITNDSTLNNLTVTMLGQTLTLKPTETLTTTIHIKTFGITGTGAYRVWAFG